MPFPAKKVQHPPQKNSGARDRKPQEIAGGVQGSKLKNANQLAQELFQEYRSRRENSLSFGGNLVSSAKKKMVTSPFCTHTHKIGWKELTELPPRNSVRAGTYRALRKFYGSNPKTC